MWRVGCLRHLREMFVHLRAFIRHERMMLWSNGSRVFSYSPHTHLAFYTLRHIYDTPTLTGRLSFSFFESITLYSLFREVGCPMIESPVISRVLREWRRQRTDRYKPADMGSLTRTLDAVES